MASRLGQTIPPWFAVKDTSAKQAAMPMPVIDLRRLDKDFTDRPLAIKDIGQVCRSSGYFQVINHGISLPIMTDALEVAAKFFELSTEAKAEFESEDIQKPVRYSTSSKDGISMARSFLKHYAHPLSEWIHLWPLAPPDYREKMGNYALEIRRLALQLMDAILESLGLGQAYLKDKLEEGLQIMAVNCYPRCSHPELRIGLAPHSDYGFITIILQSSDGLEVMDGEGEWRAIPQLSSTLHVHVGDHLEVLSNGQYKSVMHRALLNPEMERISIASIHGLTMDEMVTAAKELVDEQKPSGYKESSFRDFLNYLSSANDTSGKRFIDNLRISGA